MPLSTSRAVTDTAAAGVDVNAIRTLVHKRHPQNVLLTDLRTSGGGHFVCSGRMPTDHQLFNEGTRTPRQDILFYTEVGRQASVAVSHAFLDVSLDDVFIFEGSQATMTDAVWRFPLASPPPPVAIEIKVRETIRRKNAVSRVVADHHMTIAGEQVFSGTGTWSIQQAAIFKRLRRTSVEASLLGSPDAVGTANAADADPRAPFPGNVVISAAESRQDGAEVTASLIVDRTHPFFFDHPCDHVPGMLLLEGCAQLALAALAGCDVVASMRPAVVAYDVNFAQFVECGPPTILTARLTEDHRSAAGAIHPPIEIVISQGGVVAGTARMRIGLPV